MKRAFKVIAYGALLASLGLGFLVAIPVRSAEQTLLNVSYDPTRQLYEQVNEAFARYWTETTGNTVTIEQSHGGSGRQAQAVIDGLQADVVTLALQGDIDRIAQAGLIDKGGRDALPNRSTPFTSTIVFLVREGNPKGIRDWSDLVREGVEVITPNPKTSGGARWTYLAAWAYASRAFGGDEAQSIDFMRRLYGNVAVLDTGARGSTVTFAQKEIGDVLLAWETEAYLVLAQFGEQSFDIVYPALSILAEPPVAVVSANAQRHGTTELAKAYLDYLYSPEGQTIAARNHYRPSAPDTVTDQALVAGFPSLDLITIDDPVFEGWSVVQPKHFGDGGIFDQIYAQGQ